MKILNARKYIKGDVITQCYFCGKPIRLENEFVIISLPRQRYICMDCAMADEQIKKLLEGKE